MINAKNQVQELFQANGWAYDWYAMCEHEQIGRSGGWRTTLNHELPDGRWLKGEGEANRKSQADIAAAEQALAALTLDAPEDAIMADAQPGDALIKLAAYLMMGDATPSERSRWLQANESNRRLAKVFDRLWEAGDEDARKYGHGRSSKVRASVVEALIWRRFRERVLAPDANAALAEIFELVQPVETPAD